MALKSYKYYSISLKQQLSSLHESKTATVKKVYEQVSRATGRDFKFESYGKFIEQHGAGYRNFFYTAKLSDDDILRLKIGNVRGHVGNYTLQLNGKLVLSHFFVVSYQALVPLEDSKNELRDNVYRSLTIKPCTVSELVTEFTAITGLRFLFKRIDIYGKRSDGRLLEGIFFMSEPDGKNEPIQLSIMHAEGWVLTWSITCSTGTIDTADMPHPVDFLHKGVQC